MIRRRETRLGTRRRATLIALAALPGAVAALIGLGLAPGATPTTDAESPPVGEVESWAFAIGNGMLAGDADAVAERLGDFDLVVVDAEEATRREVAATRARGALMLGYLSVGTIERWRGWYTRLRPFRLRAWRDWEGEWFADVAKVKLRNRLAGRIAPRLLRKGFDGLFLDNVDMIEQRRHRAQRAGMRKLVKRLARVVRKRDGVLFAQNGARGMRRHGIARYLDGWNREDVTWTYDFERRRYVRQKPRAIAAAQRQLEAMAARGILVTATDYTRGGEAARAESVENACAAGALPYVSDIGLTARRLPSPPLRCP